MSYEIYKKAIDEVGSVEFILINSFSTEEDVILNIAELRLNSEEVYMVELKDDLGSHTLGL